MDDGNKTRKELLSEVEGLRQELAAAQEALKPLMEGTPRPRQTTATECPAPVTTRKIAAADSQAMSDHHSRLGTRPHTPLKILLIEDNPGDTRLVREILADIGAHDFTLECVSQLSQGLQYLSEDKIDLVLLDLTLPDSRGLETFYKAYALAPDIPFLIFTGLEDETLALTALQKGAQDYLIKGKMNPPAFIRAIRYATERKKSQENLRRAYDELERRVQERTAELVAANQQLRDEIKQRHQTEKEQERLLNEVQNYSEELKISNEELRGHAEELRAQNETLNTQAQELQNLTDDLESGRNLLQAVLEQMPGGVMIAEVPSERIILSNRRAEAIWQPESPDCLTDLDRFRQIPRWFPDGRPCLPDDIPLLRALKLGQTVVEEEYLLYRKTGTKLQTVHLVVNATPVRDQQGAIIAAVATYTDVTARKQAQAFLRQSEERYRSLVELSPDAILVHDKGKIVFVNKAAVRLFGATARQELLGHPIMDLAHPDYHDLIHDRIRIVRGGKSVTSTEEKILRLDGETVDVEAVGSAIMYQGRPAIQVVFRDITERNRARQALRAADEKMRAMIAASPLAIVHLDREGKIQGVNPATERIFGSRAEELLGRPLPIMQGDKQEKAGEILPRVFQGELLTGLEMRHLRKDGALIDLCFSIAPIYDENAQVISMVSLAEDITARKRAEAALAQSRAEFEAIFNSLSDVIIFADQKRRIVLANPAVKTVFGYDPEELIGQSCEMLYAHDADYEIMGRKIYRVGPAQYPQVYEMPYRRKDGTIIRGETVGGQVKDAQGNILGFVGIHRDITARKVAEAALEESQRQTAMLADFLDNSSQPFVVGFLDGRLGMFNAVYHQLLGYSQKELSRLNWQKDLTPPEWLELQKAKLDEVRRSGQPVRFEKEYLRKDGSRVPVEMFIHMRRDVQGKPLLYYAFVTDITARKEAEAALKESEERYRSLFEMNHAVMLIINPETASIVDANPAACSFYNFSREELTDKKITDFNTLSSERVFVEMQKARDCQNRVFQFRHRLAGGEIRDVEVFSGPIRIKGQELLYSIIHDITARKEAEAALERERQRLFALLEALPGSIYLQGEDFTVRFINRRGREIFGDAKNQVCYEAFHERQAPCEDCPSATIIETQTSQEIEKTIADGRTFQVYKYPFRDMDGTPCVLSLGLDITDRKQAEDALRKQAELLDLAHDAIIVRDLDTRITFWSRGAEATYGWTKEQAHGQPSHALLQTTFPVPRETVEQDVLDYGKWEGELLHTRADGQVIVVTSRWAVQCDDTGAPAAILEINRDITVRKQAEEALQESETRFRQLAENLDDAIVLVSADLQRVHYISPAYERIWGRSSASLYQEPRSWLHSVVLTDQEKVRTALRELIAGDLQAAPFPEFRINLPDGGVRWILARFFPIKNEAGEVYRIAGIASDITSRKEMEAVLKWRQEHLRQTAKMEAVGRLAGGVAHDFNNLLTVISGYGELLLSELRASDHERQQVHAILKAADQATGVTRQLLAFSRKQVLQPQILDLNGLIASLVKMFGRLVDENIKISMILEPQLGAVKADPSHMEQVVMNLVINAMDAMPQGGTLTIETANVQVVPDDTSHPPEIAPGSYVVITVADTGIGMNQEILSHIFEPFFTTKERGKATGLGLSMAYGIIKQSGGHILVESTPQQGSTFRIYLPPVADVAQPAEMAAPIPPQTMETGTILLVEDESAVRHVVERMLALKGYSVLTAQDGQEALKIGQSHQGPIHLLLTDVAMPVMGGRELAKLLLAVHPQMKVLFMSGHTEDGMLRRGVRESVINFIQKPFKADQLLRKVGKLLADSKP
jgi:two-component system cell cycle sensor histidine kinase/response regulator CckA